MKYTTYILWSSSLNKFYVGSTNNFDNRLFRHNHGQEKFTSKGVPWVLIWKVDFDSRADAFRLESKIKNRGAKRYLSDNNIDIPV